MDDTGATRKPGAPVVTALVAAASLALLLLPGAAELFVYDRARLLAGEIWRLVSGHAVHLSWSHAAWNLVLFAVAAAWLERWHRGRLCWLIGLTAAASGLYFLLFMPEMGRYGGLSGVASAALVALSLEKIRRGGPGRGVWLTVLLLFVAKVGYEILVGTTLFARSAAGPLAVVPAAHIIGAAVAAGLIAAARTRRA